MHDTNSVRYASSPILVVDAGQITELIEAAARAPTGRARICAHAGPDALVHEMLIALTAGTYVRPHRHHGKTESFHVIRGRGRVVLFEDDGSIHRVVPLEEPRQGTAFYYRLAEPRFHTVLVDSAPFVIHETTNGPFRPGDAEVAPWAPAAEADPEIVSAYVSGLRRAAAGVLRP